MLTTACISHKDVVYLQGNDNKVQSSVEQITQKPYRVQSNDVISIKIKALDQKLVEMFNVSTTGASSTSTDGLYFDGYTVDDHGNIRIPVLGEMSVLGLTLDEIRIKVEKQLLCSYYPSEITKLYIGRNIDNTYQGIIGITSLLIAYWTT